MNTHIRKENRRLMDKLNATDNRPEENPETKTEEKRFNSYFNNRRESNRIKNDNLDMLNRMVQQGSVIPPLK